MVLLQYIHTYRNIVSPLSFVCAQQCGGGHGRVSVIAENHYALSNIVDKLDRRDDTVQRRSRISTGQHTRRSGMRPDAQVCTCGHGLPDHDMSWIATPLDTAAHIVSTTVAISDCKRSICGRGWSRTYDGLTIRNQSWPSPILLTLDSLFSCKTVSKGAVKSS